MVCIYGITFDHTTNYGSCLQAYALQTAVERIAVLNERCSYRLIPLQTLLEIPPANFIGKIKRFVYRYYRKQFEEFENRYMKFADVKKVEELTLLNRQADVFMCGSDVVWNPDYNRKAGAYYLDFAEKYKFSYAASFGKTEFGEDDYKWIREKLESFDEISCRERSGVEIVRKCLNRSAELVVDPVLLLTKEDWNSIVNGSVNTRRTEKYIFVYLTQKNREFNDFVSKIQKETGLKVIRSAFSINVALDQKVFMVQKPDQWLGLLKNAEYVITNSFHATAFSVLFHKKFFTFTQPGRKKGINIRMHDFLDGLNLGERMISSVPDSLDLTDIDFSEADCKLENMRQESIRFLQRNFENAYRQRNDYK